MLSLRHSVNVLIFWYKYRNTWGIKAKPIYKIVTIDKEVSTPKKKEKVVVSFD